MKILFICGCLEPGKDGVGDYTRRLCGELMRQGVKVGILAFQDYYVNNIHESEQESEGFRISTLRLSTSLKNKERCQSAKKWIDYKNPEWLSLQFVPYSFALKGLPFTLAKQLKIIGGNHQWHIMFHELWLGLRSKDSVKYQIIGFIQRNIVKKIISKIEVKVIHTHTQFYLKELFKLNLNPKYLPIFSNIPFISIPLIETKVNSNLLKFVIFGSIHANAPVTEFAKEMSSYFKKRDDMNCCLILAGNSGFEKNKWIKEFESRNINVFVLGELKKEEVSCILQEASFGITTNPAFVIEKSGTVAAMREHNLPILVVAEDTNPKDGFKFDQNSDFKEYKLGNFSELIEKKYNISKTKGLKEISIQFLKDLNN